MKIEYKDIVLRGMEIEDIDKHIEFIQSNNLYLDWYRPWEKKDFLEEFDADIYRIQMKKKIDNKDQNTSESFIITKDDGTLLGLVDSYYIDYEYKPIKRKEESTDNKCISINIFDKDNWEKGYGSKTLIAFIDYLFEEKEYKILYAQTWSGNKRAERVLKNLGFRVVSRLKDEVEFDGKAYDYISLKLMPHNFKIAKKTIEELD